MFLRVLFIVSLAIQTTSLNAEERLLNPLETHFIHRAAVSLDAAAQIQSGEFSDIALGNENLRAFADRSNSSASIYLRFDLSDLAEDYHEGPAFLDFSKAHWGRHDVQFWVLGGSGPDLRWDEDSITWNNAPGNDTASTGLVIDYGSPVVAKLLDTWTGEDTRASSGSSLQLAFEIHPSFVVDGKMTIVVTGIELGIDDSDNRYLHIDSESPVLTLFPKVDPIAEPPGIYLSWLRDPTTTMTVQWHSYNKDSIGSMSYGPLDGSGLETLTSNGHPMAFYEDRLVHTVEITGLEPDTEYRFRLNNLEGDKGSRFYKFRTMPAELNRPIRIAVGGDVRRQNPDWMENVNILARNLDPDFIVWGGDLAYSDGREDLLYTEIEFFDIIRETLVTHDGRFIPTVVGIGNHEVYLGRSYYRHVDQFGPPQDNDEWRELLAPYFFNLWAFPGHPGYNYLDFGDYMTLVLPDTGHLNPIEGKQTEWLQEVLQRRKHIPHLIPVYHVPAYPSNRSFTGRAAVIREHWVPLFEEAGVRIAFEHHDHTFKRTIPILNNEPHPDGIVYIGDGAWGVPTRAVHDPKETWYLEKASSERHFILLTIYGETQDAKVINENGTLIDHHISRPWVRPD